MQHYFKQHKHLKWILISVLALSGPVLFLTTDPNKLPLPLLILPFAWLFALLYSTLYMAIRLRTKASVRQGRILAGLFAFLVVLLAVFQSIHQLTIRDVLISVSIILLAAVYLLRADFIK